MAKTLVFDARFANQLGIGQVMDSSIFVDLYESGNPASYKERRTLGSNQDTSIIQASDAQGTFYTTRVDVSTYTVGDVTSKWFATLSGTPTNPSPFVETLPYPFASTITGPDVKDYIRSMLGFPAVAVELTDTHYRTILDETLATYNQHLPLERNGELTLVPGQSRYPLPNVPNRGPFRVESLRKTPIPYISDPFFGSREFTRGIGNVDFPAYYAGISMWETYLRTTGLELEWRWDESTKCLWINNGGTSGPIADSFVQYFFFDDVDLGGVRSNHFRWFRRYALAQAKKVLSRIRGKFSGAVPSPSGTLTLDSAQLAQEARVEEEELMDELRGMGHPVPPILG